MEHRLHPGRRGDHSNDGPTPHYHASPRIPRDGQCPDAARGGAPAWLGCADRGAVDGDIRAAVPRRLGGAASSGCGTRERRGGVALQATAAGRFRVRIDRIGLAADTSGWIDLAPGEVRDHPMSVTPRSIPLEGITVSGRSRGCSIRDNARTVARVWEEARKALDAITLTQSAARVHFDTESFRRELDPRTLSVRAEQRRSSFDHTENPFRSVPVEGGRRGHAVDGPGHVGAPIGRLSLRGASTRGPGRPAIVGQAVHVDWP